MQRVYTPADLADAHWEDIGLPGRYPYTRGPYPDDVPRPPLDDAPDRRLRHAEETNERFQYLIAQGQTGLSVDFDMPTLMGFDSRRSR